MGMLVICRYRRVPENVGVIEIYRGFGGKLWKLMSIERDKILLCGFPCEIGVETISIRKPSRPFLCCYEKRVSCYLIPLVGQHFSVCGCTVDRYLGRLGCACQFNALKARVCGGIFPRRPDLFSGNGCDSEYPRH